MSANNSAEYRTLVAHTNDLRLAVQADLTNLSGVLVAASLITMDASEDIRNQMHPRSQRAAKLVGLIQTKVLQNPKVNYKKFIDVLRRDLMQYDDILDKLQSTYESSGYPQDLSGDGIHVHCNFHGWLIGVNVVFCMIEV